MWSEIRWRVEHLTARNSIALPHTGIDKIESKIKMWQRTGMINLGEMRQHSVLCTQGNINNIVPVEAVDTNDMSDFAGDAGIGITWRCRCSFGKSKACVHDNPNSLSSAEGVGGD